jgi:hypothetical protein
MDEPIMGSGFSVPADGIWGSVLEFGTSYRRDTDPDSFLYLLLKRVKGFSSLNGGHVRRSFLFLFWQVFISKRLDLYCRLDVGQ